MKKIVIYTMKGCSHCDRLKNKLSEEKISYINKDIDIYETEYNRISSKLETDFIPLIKIDDEWLVPEKDFDTINECVNKIKKVI